LVANKGLVGVVVATVPVFSLGQISTSLLLSLSCHHGRVCLSHVDVCGGRPQYAEQKRGIDVALVAIELIAKPDVVVGRPPFLLLVLSRLLMSCLHQLLLSKCLVNIACANAFLV